MSRTLTLPAGTPLRLSTDDAVSLAGSARSGRNMSFPRRIPCKSAATAFAETAVPAVANARRPGSLYEVLRLKANASTTEIKTAYRSLAKLYHPDAGSSDGQDFMAIHNAYATLSDPTAKAVYDVSMGAGLRARRIGYASGVCQTRRWETDQCW